MPVFKSQARPSVWRFRRPKGLTLGLIAVSLSVFGPVADASNTASRPTKLEVFGVLCRVGGVDYVDSSYTGWLASPLGKPFEPSANQATVGREADPCSQNRIRVGRLDWSDVLVSEVKYRGVSKSSAEPVLVRGVLLRSGSIQVRSIDPQGFLKSSRFDGFDITVDGEFRSSITFSRNWLSACSKDLGAYEPVGPSPSFDALRREDSTGRVRRLISGRLELITGLSATSEFVKRWVSETAGVVCVSSPPVTTQPAYSASDRTQLGLPKDARVTFWTDNGSVYLVVQASMLSTRTIDRLVARFGNQLIVDTQVRTTV